MYPGRIQITVLVAIMACATASGDQQTDWPSWRGPDDSGSTEVGSYPVHFKENNVRWKTPLSGKGCSTPIVLGKTIFVTAPADGNDALHAIGWDGKPRWTTTFGPEDPGKHRNGSGCNASPVSDGEAVFAYFKSGTLASVELNGEVRWKINLVQRFGPVEMFWDHPRIDREPRCDGANARG